MHGTCLGVILPLSELLGQSRVDLLCLNRRSLLLPLSPHLFFRFEANGIIEVWFLLMHSQRFEARQLLLKLGKRLESSEEVRQSCH